MTAAQGIHAHDSQKLGRKPEDKSKPKLAFEHHLVAIPDHPITDVKVVGVSYGMDMNDKAGDCVVAGTDHACQAVAAAYGVKYTPWTDDQILKLYQTQNPGMHSWADAGSNADEGMIVAQFLSYLVKNGEQFGLTGPMKLLGFAKVDNQKPDQYKAGIYMGVALVTGSNLQEAQQSGNVWDYVPGSPDWGGHCTSGDGYDPTTYDTISWGSDGYKMTQAFVTHRMDEAYFLLFQCMVDNPSLREHFDLYSFAQAYQAVTGAQFPVHVDPPGPSPTPGPTPAPPGGTIQVSQDVLAHIEKVAAKANEDLLNWVNNHFRKYFKMGS